MPAHIDSLTPPVAPLKSGLMIAWKGECYRSAATARSFAVPLELISRSHGRGKLSKLLAYVRNAAATMSVLSRNQVSTIICLNQPPFLPLICSLWAVFNGSQIVMDFHSGALTKRRWRIFTPFYRRAVRKAPFTLVHNRFDGEIIQRWGGRPVHLIAMPQVGFSGIERRARQGRPMIFFVCSFAPDEPVGIAVEAMKACPDYDFIISGDFRKQMIRPNDMPKNVQLAGFMKYNYYLDAMARASAVLTLSDRPHIMQMAVHEALTLGTPVITNISLTLHEVLGDGGVQTTLEVVPLAIAMRKAVEEAMHLESGMQDAKANAWYKVANEMQRAVKLSPDMFMTHGESVDTATNR